MKAGGGAKKRKLSGWPESEASNKAIEFNSILHGNSSGLEVLLLNRIAIAKSLSPPPIVYDLDWNPKPRSCNGKNAIAMLACASSYGAHIYYYPRSTRTWTTVVMMNRPTRKGDCIRWHKSGRTLATTSNYSDEKDGKVTIFSYDNKTLCFDATGSYSIKEHRNVSSLAWITGTEILVGAIFPSSWLYFFELKEGLISCVHQEECNGFPTNSPIVLQPDPNTTYFFAACEDATKILVWNKLEGSDHIWTIIRSV
ncbi:uncharacterized protein LOC101762453 [Setaria italica]|nr:uncharacterized protein LOC101762453 [Setaria italica]